MENRIQEYSEKENSFGKKKSPSDKRVGVLHGVRVSLYSQLECAEGSWGMV